MAKEITIRFWLGAVQLEETTEQQQNEFGKKALKNLGWVISDED